MDECGTPYSPIQFILAFIVLAILVCIPAGILLGFDYLTKFQYHWYAWGIMFAAIFIFDVWITFRGKNGRKK